MRLPTQFLTGCTQLIETGSGTCAGIRLALEAGVPLIHSIELNEALYRSACEQFAQEPRVKLYFGSSPDVLREVVRPLPGTVFWLDAHWSGGLWSTILDERYGECPLLAELEVIRALNWAEPPLILVDDAGLFNPERHPGLGFYDFEQWPTRDEIVEAVKPWPVWLHGVDNQSVNDDCQLVIGRSEDLDDLR